MLGPRSGNVGVRREGSGRQVQDLGQRRENSHAYNAVEAELTRSSRFIVSVASKNASVQQ